MEPGSPREAALTFRLQQRPHSALGSSSPGQTLLSNRSALCREAESAARLLLQAEAFLLPGGQVLGLLALD